MNCWACGEELIWGGDHDDESGIYLIETNLSCSNCEAVVIVYHGKGENYDNEEKIKMLVKIGSYPDDCDEERLVDIRQFIWDSITLVTLTSLVAWGLLVVFL